MDHHRCRVSRERHHCLPIRPSQNGSHFQSTEFKNKSGNKHAFQEKSTKFGQLYQKLNNSLKSVYKFEQTFNCPRRDEPRMLIYVYKYSRKIKTLKHDACM